MKVLVTGATGLIGSSLGIELVRNQHSIRALVRKPDKARLQLPFPCELLKWEGIEDPLPDSTFDEIDAVVHLAGEPLASGRWSSRRKQSIRDSRITGTRKLVQAIINRANEGKSIPKCFVLGSAVGFYRDGQEQQGKSIENDFLSKLVHDWEEQIAPLQTLPTPPRCVRIRTGVVLSDRGGALSMMLPVFLKGLGAALGSGKQWMNWIHLTDLVNIFIEAIENPQYQGPIDGVAPHPVSNREFTETLNQILKRKGFLDVPPLALKAIFGEMSDVLLKGGRALGPKPQDPTTGYIFRYPVLAEALQSLLSDRLGPRGETIEKLIFEQWVPHPIEQVFSFFSKETNLESITPPFLAFRVLNKSTLEIEEGTLINYQLKLHGLPIKWQSRIQNWNPPHAFVDTQTIGPYQYWHHLHEFESLAGGTLIRDCIHYRLPIASLSSLLVGSRVEKDLQKIFQYRQDIIGNIFK